APLAHIDARARLDFGPFGSVRLTDSETGIGDVSVNPVTIYGGDGPLYWSLAEHVTAPTGRFRADRIASPGRNHWSFDTVAALSWIDWAAGYEIAAAAGVIANTRNRATDYRTGAEAHLDASFNMLLAPDIAVGATLYGLAALERDRGAGAGTDPPKPQALGAGLQAIWTPDPADFAPSIRVKWLHDISARDRLKGDAVFLIVEAPLN
ncbi:MAG: transporter, partial [Alphaproteobacteria bacterium]